MDFHSAQPLSGETAVAPMTTPPPESPERILVIDDEERMCASLKALLDKAGYLVETISDGYRALEKITTDYFDLVIADIKMPGVDGLRILRTAKSRDPDALVILMTGYASVESAVSAISDGAYDYLMKPIDFPDLKLAVKRALEKRRSDKARLNLMRELNQKNELLQHKLSELDALYQAAKSLSVSVSLDELLQKIITLATVVIGARVGSIMLVDEKGNALLIRASIGLEPEIARNTRLSLGTSIAGYVAQRNEAVVVEDVEKDPRFRRVARTKYETRSLLCVPLCVKNRVLGVINLADKKGGGCFCHEDLQLLITFASQVAVAIDDAQLFEQTKKKMTELSVLHDIAARLATIDRFDAMTSTIHAALAKIIWIDFTLWFDWRARDQKLVLLHWQGLTPPIEHQVQGFEVSMTQAEVVDDFCRKAKATQISQALFTPEQFTGWLTCVPVLSESALHGALVLGRAHIGEFTSEEEHLVAIVMSQVAAIYERQRAIQNATRLVTMGTMMSEISHDLKAPLTNIRGSLQLLREKLSPQGTHRELLAMAEQEVYRLSELVKELVDFSNPNKYRLEARDLALLLKRAVKLLEADLAKKNILVDMEVSSNLPQVFVNENEIIELLLNLILNAVDSMQVGGRLCLGAKETVAGVDQEPVLQLWVKDQGCGIPPENLSRIFDRYFTTKPNGTGLGLAIVERIAKAHNGSVSVKSEPGKGTTFFINLPYAP